MCDSSPCRSFNEGVNYCSHLVQSKILARKFQVCHDQVCLGASRSKIENFPDGPDFPGKVPGSIYGKNVTPVQLPVYM